MQVKFVDLGRQYADLRDEILASFDEISAGGWFVMGPHLEEFEKGFAELCGVRHAIGVANGSDALRLSLNAHNIGLGDEVITAPNSFLASAAAIDQTGARIVFCDVGEDMNLDPDKLADAITDRTRAIMPVHLTGRVARMEEIAAVAGERGIPIIEDAAQAVGASRGGKMAGSFGATAAFSLHPLKNLFVHGDGGVITTDSDLLAEIIRRYRNHGLKNRDEAAFWGVNSRLDEIHAAIGSLKLKHLDAWNARHREIASRYSDELNDHVRVPMDECDEECVYHRYMIRTPQRDALQSHLAARGVETKVNYPIPLHLQEAAADLGYGPGSFPVCEELAKTILSLPVHSHMTDEEADHVIAAIKDFRFDQSNS